MAQEDDPAPIVVGGNIYGGGNKGKVSGNTTVNVRGGDLNQVFGGARMAEVGGRSYVNIDGEHAIDYMVINKVYGGNDIAGTIGTDANAKVQPELTHKDDLAKAEDKVDNTWDAYVRITAPTTTRNVKIIDDETGAFSEDPDNKTKEIYIGQLFAGGNGDYFYDSDTKDNKTTHKIYFSEADAEEGKQPIATKVTAEGETGFVLPELKKTYLEILGGSIVYAYGGGNNATVTEKAIICYDNPSDVVNHIEYKDGETWKDKLTNERFKRMGIDTGFSYPSSADFQVGRLFGGNNKAEMAIRPTWNLRRGWVRNLYSGGNKGAMTHNEGLLLEIAESSTIVVDNLYGGCRMADVVPLLSGTYDSGKGTYEKVPLSQIQLADKDPVTHEDVYKFPSGFAARVLVRGGDINNVYGGNDITGRVEGGNAVGVYTSIRGNLYGGGNGSYPYTDKSELMDNDVFKDMYGDLYYDPITLLGLKQNDGVTPATTFDGAQSIEALNKFRPDAEQVSIHLLGTAEKPTIIHGSVYLGGNCATLDPDPDKIAANEADPTKYPNYPKVELKLGSYVIADNVFMGNNGEMMVHEDVLKHYRGSVFENATTHKMEVDLTGTANGRIDFSQIDLTDATQMSAYMDGAAMSLKPDTKTRITFDDDYKDYSTYIGSFFCGGNVGSMTYSGEQTMNFNVNAIIYNKIVGGCNNAFVPRLYVSGIDDPLNAAYEGGILGALDERDSYVEKGKIKNRLLLNFDGIRIEPKRWAKNEDGTYKLDDHGNQYLEWNTAKWNPNYTPIREYTELAVGQTYFTKDEENYVVNIVPKGETVTTNGTQYTNTIAAPTTYVLIPANTTLEAGDMYYTKEEKYTINTVEGESITADGTTQYRTDPHFDNVDADDVDDDTRLLGGNIYGGCYNTGIVNGNVVINIKDDLINKNHVFSESKVNLENQSSDLLSVAMTVFGAGYGKRTEIWGSTTVNHTNGYAFQIFGGGEKGYVGKGETETDASDINEIKHDSENYIYKKYITYATNNNPLYSTTVNLNSTATANDDTESVDELAEAEYIYGAGNQGDVCGNSYVYLGNGRIYDAFGGASDANVYGHTEVYIGGQPKWTTKQVVEGAEATTVEEFKVETKGFPWIRDIVYGANDFGGKIWSKKDFKDRLRTETTYGKVHGTETTGGTKAVLQANSYVEYLQGHVYEIYGGNYGDYDYTDPDYIPASGTRPDINASFVNIRPADHDNNYIGKAFGGGEGHSHDRVGDKMQDRSYVLVDIPDDQEYFRTTEVFGAGNNNGIGMLITQYSDPDEVSAIVDLVSGQIANAFGGSYNEGITRRTVVNVPVGSTITMYTEELDKDENGDKNIKEFGNIFGGSYGTQILPPCDVYESNVNYRSSDAVVMGSIFGGNNNERRTLRTHVNIYSPVWSNVGKATKGYQATVYGAGRGKDTWAEYTEVNLEDKAQVYEVYGGGMMGHVLNTESVQKYMQLYQNEPSNQIATDDPDWKIRWKNDWHAAWKDAWTFGDYYEPDGIWEDYLVNSETNYDEINERTELDDNTASQLANTKKYNTNVIIKAGAKVSGYAYGGGYGKTADPLSGDVYGTTYIALLGGTVEKDLYAAGTAGSINDIFGAKTFTASANAYIQGGTVRNVYGGGWKGNVGVKDDDEIAKEIPGKTHVVIGKVGGTSFFEGVPAIQRNAYAGGEGGSIIGTANITVNNGYIGYRYLGFDAPYYFTYTGNTDVEHPESDVLKASGTPLEDCYVMKLDDETYKDANGHWKGTNRLEDCGNVFGSGYDDLSSVDISNVTIYGGTIRNSVFGGGEIATIGRGTNKNNKIEIFKAGKTHIYMFNGTVLRNIFGGGKGYNSLGYGGANNLHTDGYVFGQTDVNIHGGTIGTVKGVEQGYGNVFGGGNRGFVYSAYELNNKTYYGIKSGERYVDEDEGYYYKGYYKNNQPKFVDDVGADLDDDAEKHKTEDCHVLIEPWLQVKEDEEIDFEFSYKKGDIVPQNYLHFLRSNPDDEAFTAILAKIDNDGKVTAEDGITFTRTYYEGEYVPTAYLNTLPKKSADGTAYGTWPGGWADVDAGDWFGEGDDRVYIERGIIIHNAVFAGGNIASGSTMNANTPTVFGNATASVHDVYHRDLITIGTGHTGGLYGDGNLTFVDGYRGLNITNYGTDYYGIDPEIQLTTYKNLPPREQDYYELRYKCFANCQDRYGTAYKPAGTDTKASTINTDDLLLLFLVEVEKKDDQDQPVLDEDNKPVMELKSVRVDNDGKLIADSNGKPITDDNIGTAVLEQDENDNWIPNSSYWVENGVCSRYAGRIMNTIQRADFCGVFGSRMVMQGARDRVADKSDNTNYTINRVREVSLNKKISIAGDAVNSDSYLHGNYFGIYSLVNHLGALTSDVDFESDIRTTENIDEETYQADIVLGNDRYEYGNANYTFYNWKKAHQKDRIRNNGKSHNQVALASGVYLELTTEKSTGTEVDEKDWGIITGVVELDLINVSKGVGGGFVYAKNVHGTREATGKKLTTLTELNKGAITNKIWKYVDEDETSTNTQEYWETSGNFVHSTQTIIDDCYNISGRYKIGENPVPAHYWYIKGQVYIYDQYISAYTGSPNAYSETVDIPLTIAAASNGKIHMVDVQPNLYAYYSNAGSGKEKLDQNQQLKINEVSYNLNDPITYWDWSLLPASEKQLFRSDTYVNCVPVCIDNETDGNNQKVVYEAGTYVMLKSDFDNFGDNHTYTDADGNTILDDQKNEATKDYIFRSSNNLSHEKGYILTYEVNNPSRWDQWYTRIEANNGGTKARINTEDYNKITLEHSADNTEGKDDYYDGPTYTLKAGKTGLYGQLEYEYGDIIAEKISTTYTAAWGKLNDTEKAELQANKPQATFEQAYVMLQEYTSGSQHYNEGAAVPASQGTTMGSSNAVPAYVCTNSISLSETEFVVLGDLLTKAEWDTLKDRIDNQIIGLSTNITSTKVNKNIQEVKVGDLYTSTEVHTSDELAISDLGEEKFRTLKSLLALREEIYNNIDEAYICTSQPSTEPDGYKGPFYYGGDYYEVGKNYRGLEVWSSMSEIDRNNFTFNYDALDLLINPDFLGGKGEKYLYDAEAGTYAAAEGTDAQYSLKQPIDYEATFVGTYKDKNNATHTISSMSYTYTDANGDHPVTIEPDDVLKPEEYERIPNEQRHYAQFSVTDKNNKRGEGNYTVYIVNTNFVNNNGPYTIGQSLTNEEYDALSDDDHDYITTFNFTSTTGGPYYYCREPYVIGQNGDYTYGDGTIETPSSTLTPSLGTTVTAALANENCYYYTGNVKTTENIAINAQKEANQIVPVGYVIDEDTYDGLTNMQLGFSIHGISPKEYSTLYVSRNSNLYDLSQEKIITVIYQYDYEESNESGTQITPVSEYHVVNIHINFKSGIPTVADINAPEIILPGTSLTMKDPAVTPGAYEVYGGGWELFENDHDAETHTNGIDYTSGIDSLYWYQDGYYIAYYARTYLGRTYSNHVPVSVANYHDLKKVMDDKRYHLHVDYDRTKLKRDSKIYINDYTSSDQNGLDLLKDLFDLSLLTENDVDIEHGLITTNKGTSTDSPFKGHALLNNSGTVATITDKDGKEKRIRNGVKGGENLEFYLRTNIDHGPITKANPEYDPENNPSVPETITDENLWTSIGSDDQCFEGTLHGDGYTISGLTNSLFYNLCGDVYNLGVTGSFTSAGVVDKGNGYVESSWISSSSAPVAGTKPVFGNPSRTGDVLTEKGKIQIVNSYYQEEDDATNKYTNHTGDYGIPTRKPATAFYNGEVAYDLNSFYLTKRYYDGKGTTTGTGYQYIGQKDINNTDDANSMSTYYVDHAKSDYAKYSDIGYVEDRYEDGDFRFAAGVIPSSEDQRLRERTIIKTDEKGQTVEKKETFYAPLWPNDYLFFGQNLTFGYNENKPHQDVPSHYTVTNRVYRAPAYYGNSIMSVAHFNPDVILAGKEKLTDAQIEAHVTARDAYPGMTAIDFAGHNDLENGYKRGLNGNWFYQPLLDDDGLTSIKNEDETRNLLAYAPAASGESGYVNKLTHDVLNGYFIDPAYAVYNDANKKSDERKFDDTDTYGRVATVSSEVYGHVVQSDLTATNDHMLVDKQDFNAPIKYNFLASNGSEEGTRMWYQRHPENFAGQKTVTENGEDIIKYDRGAGWEGVSIPFEAEYVATNKKGEITHFYRKDESNNFEKGHNSGHEYWLRGFEGVDKDDVSTTDILEATFLSPLKASYVTKTDANTFLWDYYYYAENRIDQKDKNSDKYQEYDTEYYKKERSYAGYPRLTNAKPYIIGFPGQYFYEFDLSGVWTPSYTFDNDVWDKLGKQTITFASAPGITIAVSDNELADNIVTKEGYNFTPNYMNTALAADPDNPEVGTRTVNYALNGDGNSYDVVKGTAKTVSAFRPYFTARVTKESGVAPRRININGTNDMLQPDLDERHSGDANGGLIISVDKRDIVVESTRRDNTTVRITTTSGITVTTFTIEPGQIVRTPVNMTGVYIVNQTKLVVK